MRSSIMQNYANVAVNLANILKYFDHTDEF